MRYPQNWVDDMLGALADEIEHVRKPGNGERMFLTRGRPVPHDEPDSALHLYEFEVSDSRQVPGLLGGDLWVGAYRAPVQVVVESWPRPGWIRIWSENDLGSNPGRAELTYHSDGVLQGLFARLQDLRKPVEERITAFCTGDYREATPSVARWTACESQSLSTQQQEAVTTALTSPVSRLWGPPGTGKTYTAAALASEWLRAGWRVILAGPTHRSVDLLLLEVLRLLEWSPDEVENRIVRVGEIGHRELRDWWGPHISLPGSGQAQIAEDPDGDRPTTRDLISRAQVVATTAHRVALGQVPAADAMVLDEASMVSLPVGLLASLHSSHLTLVGDPMQLGPVVKSRTRRARRWLGAAVFDSREDSSRPISIPGPTVFLDEQFRMPPTVARFVSSLSYGGRLRSAPSTECDDHPELPGPGRDLIYRSTSDLSEVRASPMRDSQRLENRAQAQLVIRILTEWLASSNNSDPGIAVISPYRSHVRALGREADRAGLASEVVISTVHRFQGEASPTVVLSIPERWGERPGKFIKAKRLVDPGGRLLTVAASRATERLLVVGDLAWLRHAAPSHGPARRFVDLLMDFGTPLGAFKQNSESSVHGKSSNP